MLKREAILVTSGNSVGDKTSSMVNSFLVPSISQYANIGNMIDFSGGSAVTNKKPKEVKQWKSWIHG